MKNYITDCSDIGFGIANTGGLVGGRRAWSAVGVRMFCIQVEMVDDHGFGELQKKFTHNTSYMYQNILYLATIAHPLPISPSPLEF